MNSQAARALSSCFERLPFMPHPWSVHTNMYDNVFVNRKTIHFKSGDQRQSKYDMLRTPPCRTQISAPDSRPKGPQTGRIRVIEGIPGWGWFWRSQKWRNPKVWPDGHRRVGVMVSTDCLVEIITRNYEYKLLISTHLYSYLLPKSFMLDPTCRRLHINPTK